MYVSAGIWGVATALPVVEPHIQCYYFPDTPRNVDVGTSSTTKLFTIFYSLFGYTFRPYHKVIFRPFYTCVLIAIHVGTHHVTLVTYFWIYKVLKFYYCYVYGCYGISIYWRVVSLWRCGVSVSCVVFTDVWCLAFFGFCLCCWACYTVGFRSVLSSAMWGSFCIVLVTGCGF